MPNLIEKLIKKKYDCNLAMLLSIIVIDKVNQRAKISLESDEPGLPL